MHYGKKHVSYRNGYLSIKTEYLLNYVCKQPNLSFSWTP